MSIISQLRETSQVESLLPEHYWPVYEYASYAVSELKTGSSRFRNIFCPGLRQRHTFIAVIYLFQIINICFKYFSFVSNIFLVSNIFFSDQRVLRLVAGGADVLGVLADLQPALPGAHRAPPARQLRPAAVEDLLPPGRDGGGRGGQTGGG